MSSSQIGKMFYGVMKGSRVSCSCRIELHCSVALLLWGSRSHVSYACPWKLSVFFSFTITGRGVEIEKSVYPNMEKKTICMHLFKSYISVTRSSYQPACGFPSMSHSQAPPCLCRCYSLTWHCLFSLCALCVPSLSWRLHSCILTSVKPSLPPSINILQHSFSWTSIDCYINLYQTHLLHTVILSNVSNSPHWHQIPWDQTISYFPLSLHRMFSTYYTYERYNL